VSKEDEKGVVGVKKKNYTFLKRKQRESKHEASILSIDLLLNSELVYVMNSNSCCSFNC
jgi:hypothetical protein